MNKFSAFILLITIASIYHSCIDPLPIESQEARIVLVVEGTIDTQPGPHTIFVSKSAQYGSRAVGEITLERNATVWLRTETGEQIFLQEESSGTYITPVGFQAEVGKSYTLFINLESGDRYTSLPEKVLPVPEILGLEAQYKELPSLDDFRLPVGVDIFAKWQDPPNIDNYYLWDTRSVYKVHTRPDLHLSCGPGGCFLDPKDCCPVCYVTEPQLNKEIRIFKDNFTDGKEQLELIQHVSDDGRRYAEKIMIVVEQSSLTKEAYQFFNILKDQLAIDGDIFDPPAAAIRGNMINLDDPNEPTIGYFRASDIDKDTIYIEKSFLVNPSPLDLIRDDCRELKNSVLEKPPYWQE